MTTTTDQIDIDTLEGMIDTSSLSYVLRLIQGICFDKVEHIRSNWPDLGPVSSWESARQQINNIMSHIDV